MPDFNIKKDIELIANGTHFWCEGHLSAVPIDDISQDTRYCQSCFDVLKAEAEMQPTRRAVWMPKIIKTANISHGTATKATQTAPEGQDSIAKIVQPIISPITEKEGIMQQRGRPRKEGEVHRVTRWRRAKQGVQGVLI